MQHTHAKTHTNTHTNTATRRHGYLNGISAWQTNLFKIQRPMNGSFKQQNIYKYFKRLKKNNKTSFK